MNVEFLIHGVMSSGQTWWKQTDSDYYKQFYSGQNENTVMMVEVVSRPHGISTYYNYLRNNNIQASREGAYFGITVRIDEACCLDVATMFRMLDNIFQKMIVGSILNTIPGSDRFEYAVASFEAAKPQLEHIERQFSSMLKANLTKADFMPIGGQLISKGTRTNINPLDADCATVRHILQQNAKIYTSPAFPSKENQKVVERMRSQTETAIAEAQNRVAAATDETQRLRASNTELQQQVSRLNQELGSVRDDVQKLQQKVKQNNCDQELKAEIAKIQQPITQLAQLMANRFPDKDGGKRLPKPKWSKWLLYAVVALLMLLLVLAIYLKPKAETETPSQPTVQVESLVPDTIHHNAQQSVQLDGQEIEPQN